MRKPLSTTSAHPLRSPDRLDHFVARARSALAQSWAFAVTGPSTWNGLLLFYGLSSCLRFLCILSFSEGVSFPQGLPRWKRLWILYAAKGAPKMFRNYIPATCIDTYLHPHKYIYTYTISRNEVSKIRLQRNFVTISLSWSWELIKLCLLYPPPTKSSITEISSISWFLTCWLTVKTKKQKSDTGG